MSVGNLFRIFLCKRFSGRRKCSGGKNVRSDSFGPFSPTFIFAHFCRQIKRAAAQWFPALYDLLFDYVFFCSFFCRWLCWVPLCFFSFFVRAFFIALRLKQKRQVPREILLWNFFRRDRTGQRKNSKKRVRKATNPR